MELDNIIWIIVWAFIIVYSLISSKNNKARAQQRQKRGPQPAAQRPQPRVDMADMAKGRLAALSGALAALTAEPSKEPEAQTWHKQLPVEGERVTASPMLDTVAESGLPSEEPSWLKDKENLKKAVIFGQILQPKF